MRAFYEIVGAVSLDGSFPDDHPWYENTAFPVSPLTVADLLPNFDRWMEAREDEGPSVDLDVCYDPAGVLGAFTLPGPSQLVDEPLEMEGGYTLPGPYGGQMLFVEYLRISLHWGGFSSLAYPHRSDVPERDVAPLVESFLLF